MFLADECKDYSISKNDYNIEKLNFIYMDLIHKIIPIQN